MISSEYLHFVFSRFVKTHLRHSCINVIYLSPVSTLKIGVEFTCFRQTLQGSIWADKNATVLTSDNVELGLRHLGRTVRLPERDLCVVLAVNVLGQARVHSVVALINRCHQQVAVRTLAELLHVNVVLYHAVVEQPRDGSVRQRLGNARQVHRHPVPSPHLLNHVAGVHWRELDGKMPVFRPFASLRWKCGFFTIILMFVQYDIGNKNTRL